MSRITLLLACVMLVTACSQQQENAAVDVQSTGTITVSSVVNVASADEYQPRYIYAEDLNNRVVDGSSPFVFDVRSSHAFEKSHLLGSYSMPYGKTDKSLLASVDGLDKGSEIVTYCGCPRHLSTLAAKNLNGRGYNNVKVLYEGYWHWVDKGYPTEEQSGNIAGTTRLDFEGRVSGNSGNDNGIDVFLRHNDTGQLEAAATDENGRFKMEFTLYDYQPGDAFSVVIRDIAAGPVEQVYVTADGTAEIDLTL